MKKRTARGWLYALFMMGYLFGWAFGGVVNLVITLLVLAVAWLLLRKA